ncbi:MAG: cobyrinic acid a,c-diamide synthase [Kordia sp.]|nr:MAG: cobyrinic acid a,c-diamide synthase [Kordia sp.]
MNKQLIISAPNSNAGKTTITLGLLRLLKNKKITVQPFKVGPDYIDPKFHELACAKVGVNLDLFMMKEDEINTCLSFYGKDTQVNCVEGVMGLFDGAKKDQGSTAELAKKLKTPVLMVIDAKAVAYSVAPLIQGFVNFDKEVDIMGVVFNRVGSERHYLMLKEACEDIGVHCFGYLSNLKNIAIPSRHLGLNILEIEKFDTVIDQIADELEKTVNWKAILGASKEIETKAVSLKQTVQERSIKFAVAKDEAFNFIYPQNIAAMKQLGKVHFFSPIHDTKIPDSDFIYFPGGYPESYLKELSSNKEMLTSIKEFLSVRSNMVSSHVPPGASQRPFRNSSIVSGVPTDMAPKSASIRRPNPDSTLPAPISTIVSTPNSFITAGRLGQVCSGRRWQILNS